MVKLLFLMTGGALGTLARYLASGLARRLNMAGATVLKEWDSVPAAGSIRPRC